MYIKAFLILLLFLQTLLFIFCFNLHQSFLSQHRYSTVSIIRAARDILNRVILYFPRVCYDFIWLFCCTRRRFIVEVLFYDLVNSWFFGLMIFFWLDFIGASFFWAFYTNRRIANCIVRGIYFLRFWTIIFIFRHILLFYRYLTDLFRFLLLRLCFSFFFLCPICSLFKELFLLW